MQTEPVKAPNLSQELARIAAEAALSLRELLVSAFETEKTIAFKTGHFDLVTEYDREAERQITAQLLQQYPDSTIIGEEGGTVGQGTVHWFVDPIDGTTNFAAGLPFFCVSIAAVLDREVLAGVVYDPIRDELFLASQQGAFLNQQPIVARGGKTDADAVLATAFPLPGGKSTSADFAFFQTIVENFRGVRRIGSAALQLAYVACGRLDVAYEPYLSPWDIAAGYLLVKKSGGVYLPQGDNQDLDQLPWFAKGYLATCPQFDLQQSSLQALLKDK
jgi:myo-inositol-1(or 4)-monophosphatase